jgi:electron transfer flavoprotein beta subunit
MNLAVCWKHAELGGPAAAQTGEITSGGVDTRWAGVSPADEAALEIALSLRELAGAESTVTVVALGSAAVDAVLRTALAAGADRAVRIDASSALDGATVADALAVTLGDVDHVWCGDYSLDRGSGSVPAFVADRLGAAQALGLIGVELPTFRADQPLRVVRRLDGGRRELLDVTPPAVLSVEGSVASLRRAGLAATLASKSAEVEVVPGPPSDPDAPVGVVTPYRPRARALPPPIGVALDRVRDLLKIGSDDSSHPETVTLEPQDAAVRILAQLREWGYLGDDPPID